MPSLTIKRDPEMLNSGVLAALKPFYDSIVVGSAEDVQAFGVAIAADLGRAISDNNAARVAELKGQLKLLLEAKNLEVAKGKQYFFDNILPVAMDSIFTVGAKALLSIAVV